MKPDAVISYRETKRPVGRQNGSTDCDVAVVGAGPYGLSAGAYLKAKGLAIRVFGQPMDFWANKMPAGMLLRSPREASSIADPEGSFTLSAYERTTKTSPIAPVPLDRFVSYGFWFQHQLGADVDRRCVDRIRRENALFHLTPRGRYDTLQPACGCGRWYRTVQPEIAGICAPPLRPSVALL